MEKARQAAETRKRLLTEKEENLKEELGADEIIESGTGTSASHIKRYYHHLFKERFV